MKAKIAVGAIVIGIILAGGYWYYAKPIPSAAPTASQQTSASASVYPYECGAIRLNMSMSSDGNTIVIGAAAGGAYPPATTLTRVTASSGARYEGGGFVFTARGESVTITEDGQTLHCSPVANQEEPPFNFGD